MTTSPWTRTDAVLAAAVITVGCIVWAIGWYRVANEGAFDSQIDRRRPADQACAFAATELHRDLVLARLQRQRQHAVSRAQRHGLSVRGHVLDLSVLRNA